MSGRIEGSSGSFWSCFCCCAPDHTEEVTERTHLRKETVSNERRVTPTANRKGTTTPGTTPTKSPVVKGEGIDEHQWV